MILEEQQYLTFDDVLLKPRYSEISSRSKVDISSKLNDRHTLRVPIISANMDTVTGLEMAVAMNDVGGLGILHRRCSIKEQTNWVKQFFMRRNNGLVGAAIGVQGDDLERAMELMEAGCEYIVIDIAHGHFERMKWMIAMLKNYISKNNLKAEIISGNVATSEGVGFLKESGSNKVKIGIGPGSVCTTRIKTGHGVPQLSAIIDCHSYFASPHDNSLIADGGIRNSGDIVKALAAGAHFVMLGNLLAGATESCAKIKDGYKEYSGMAAKGNNIEGVEGLVPIRGTVEEVINDLVSGIRSGLAYSGAKNLKELREKAIFIKMTGNGLRESHPHDLMR
jgi:IMP dehydrogenase